MTTQRAGTRTGRLATRIALVAVVVLVAGATLFVPSIPHSGPAQQPGVPTAPPPAAVAVDPQFLPTVLSSTQPANYGDFGQSVAVTPTYVVVGAPQESASGIGGAGAAYIVNLTSGTTVRIVSPNPTVGGDFGYSVAAFGNLVLVGAPVESPNGVTGSGNVYLFSASGTFLQTLTSPNSQTFGFFGVSVALAGNYAVVGANGESISGYPSAGVAYLINLLTDSYRMLISSYPETDAAFGTSTSITSNLVAVGAPFDSSGGTTYEGAVYLFTVPTGNTVERILNPMPSTDASFGHAVAINGTTVVAGAPRGNSPSVAYAGAAYEINVQRNTVTPIYSPSPVADGDFGEAVAITSETIVVGAPSETSGGQFEAGNAYLFSVLSLDYVSSTFSPPGWQFSGEFGSSVAMSGSTVVVGANWQNASGMYEAGHAYVFAQVPLTVSSPYASDDGYLGASVATDDGVAVIGAPGEGAGGDAEAGHAYIVPIDPAPSLALTALTSPNFMTDGLFGAAVAISGGVIAVGAPRETSGGQTEAGNVYLFSATSGALIRTLSSPSPSSGGQFGYSVAVSGSLVIVGAPGESYDADTLAGNAYVFNGTTGALVSTLSSPNPISDGSFGLSVSISGGVAAVGAPFEEVLANIDAGHAYLFDATTGTLIAQLVSPESQSYGEFGYAVSVAGNTAAVGAPGESAGEFGFEGSAYSFDTSTGALEQSFICPDPVTSGGFGAAVATNGGTVVIGAPGETSVGLSDAGAVYVYDTVTGDILDRFYSPHAQGSGGFGGAVSEDAQRIVVGAESESPDRSTVTGFAYVFGLETSPLVPAVDYYNLLKELYNSRADLQAAFPDAFTNPTNYTELVNWAGDVVTGVFSDNALGTLMTFGYYYALMDVYDHRADLQTNFPNAFTNSASYQSLLDWAKDVVLYQPSDPAYTTLFPFAGTYEELG